MDFSSTDNIIVLLGQSNRVHEVILDLVEWQLQKVLAVMQAPFPELTHLEFYSNGKMFTVIPDSFLGGSAPRLKYFRSEGIAFPGLPKLLLSATHLAELYLINIPHSGYISPEAMVALLSVSSSLKIGRAHV